MVEFSKTHGVQSDGPPIHDASDLMQGGDIALIRLDDKIYTLRLTRTGKLILTK